jgi:DNA-binding transcriptional LysR family regulator
MVGDQWEGLEVRHLRALQVVARTGAIGRAAIELGYTQSAISQQLAALEKLVGARLVERSRGPRPVSLTEAGWLLLGHVDAILRGLHAAQRELGAMAEGLAGVLRLGLNHGVATRLVPRMVRQLRAGRPDVRICTREVAQDDELFDMLEARTIDIALMELPLRPGPFQALALTPDPWMLVVSTQSPLGARATIASLDDLGGQPLIAPGFSRSIAKVTNRLREHGLDPRFVYQSEVAATVQALAAANLGAAILPRLAVSLDDPDTVALPLSPFVAPRIIGLAWNRSDNAHPLLPAVCATAELAVRELDSEPAMPIETTASAG